MDSYNAWQALSETSGSEDARVRSVLACLTAHMTAILLQGMQMRILLFPEYTNMLIEPLPDSAFLAYFFE